MNELVEYKNSLCSLKNLLGLGCFHILEKEELLPYTTKILSKLNERLILEDKENFEENINLFVEYYKEELDLFTSGEVQTLMEKYECEGDEVLFGLSWMNIFTTIYIEEMYNYAYLFTDSSLDCHECCGTITEDDYGNSVFIPGKTNISLPYVCGCLR